MEFDFDLVLTSLPKLLSGAVLTLELVAVAVVAGAILALGMALLRVQKSWWIKGIPAAYIFAFRGTPLLVQIFLIYYGLGQFEFVRQSWAWGILREAYWCAIIAFTLNTSAYSAEILRGAIQSVPIGEVEAAKALGMTRILAYRRIILPRAYRLALHAYGNEIIFMIKCSALASTITMMDLTGAARWLVARTYKPVEVFLAAGVIYLIIIYGVTLILRLIEKRFAVTTPRMIDPDIEGPPDEEQTPIPSAE